MKTRVLAGQGGHTTAQVVNRVVHVEGAGSVIKGGVVIGIVRQANTLHCRALLSL